MALSAREKMMALLPEKGWVLDTTATKYPRRTSTDRVQDPYAWTRLAAHGGRWRIVLDYDMKGSWYGSTGDTLHGVAVRWIPDGVEPTVNNVLHLGELKRPGRYDSFNGLWEALENDDEDAKPRSLRQRAELLVKNPDLAVWLSFQAKHARKVAEEAAAEKHRRERKERARPLPVTVAQSGPESYSKGGWNHLAGEAQQAAGVIWRADGRTDLPAAVARLRAAVEAIEAVLKVGVDA